MKYHVFFTTQYTDECLHYCKFGATSVNSLGNVYKDDVGFLFDGLRWEIYGPFFITSNEQFYSTVQIYGQNKRGVVNYPNRISFDVSKAKKISFTKLFSIEKDTNSYSYLTNRVLQAVIIANKQVHSTQLTLKEGEYLTTKINEYGSNLNLVNYTDDIEYPNVLNNFIENRKSKSEAFFELLLLKGRYNKDYFDLAEYNFLFNQFVLGFQRQTDIIAIKKNICLLIEIKKKDNTSNPFKQLTEYKEYLLTDSRLKEYDIDDIRTIALLENGNSYLNYSQNTLVFEMNNDYTLRISQPNW